MQYIIQLFFDILQVTGGYFATEKCAWYLICHRWENSKDEQHKGISLMSRATGSTSDINRKSPEE
jgi:hypothetical protein